MTAIFRGAATALEVSDYADVCPVATVAMEVASTNEPLRIATAEVFAAWIDAAVARLRGAGISKVEARKLASTIVGLLEGAFILCRASRTTTPMLAGPGRGLPGEGSRQPALTRSRAIETAVVGPEPWLPRWR